MTILAAILYGILASIVGAFIYDKMSGRKISMFIKRHLNAKRTEQGNNLLRSEVYALEEENRQLKEENTKLQYKPKIPYDSAFRYIKELTLVQAAGILGNKHPGEVKASEVTGITRSETSTWFETIKDAIIRNEIKASRPEVMSYNGYSWDAWQTVRLSKKELSLWLKDKNYDNKEILDILDVADNQSPSHLRLTKG
jgi:cell division protein FtsB